ncbi:MAG: hypothetical protein ACPG47_00150 [Leucothrix sp.]
MIADELITSAYYLSGVVSRDLETVSGSQLTDGLELLNDILAEKSRLGIEIPYYSHTTLNTVVGQEEYDVPGLIDLDAITFNIGEVRYSMVRMDRRYYFGSPRVDNIESLPFSYFPERVKDGMKIYLYFLPVDVYVVKITGKFALSQVAADTDLNLELDRYYESYLKYKLASRLCDFNGISFGINKDKTLFELESELDDISAPDMTNQKLSTLTSKQSGYNWADINIGRGWRP